MSVQRPPSTSMSEIPSLVALVPCFNGEKYLEASVVSLINQTHPPDQIYVIDDGSSDRSRSIIKSLEANHPTVVAIFHEQNRGKASCLNECFDRLSADYFFLQDADDISHPNRMEYQLNFMDAHPEVACSSSFIRYINACEKVVGKGTLDLVSQERLDGYLISDEPFGLFCPAVVLRGSMVRDSSLRFRQQFWPADDIDLWNRIAEKGHKVRAQPEYLVDYRIHGNSAVTSSFHKTREKFEFVRTCLRARRSANPEPTWDEFVAIRASRPMTSKLNDSRKALAKGLYRNAGFRWGEGRRLTGLLSLTASACLQPGYVLPRLRNQLG